MRQVFVLLFMLLAVVGCGNAETVIQPEGPSPLPPEDSAMGDVSGGATDSNAAPALPTPSE